MIVISGQPKKDAQDPYSDVTHSIYIESDSTPSIETAEGLLQRHFGKAFDRSTIVIEELKGKDADQMRKDGLTIQKI